MCMKSYGPGLQATRSFNAYVLNAWSRDNSWGGGGNREGEASTMGGSEAKTPTHTHSQHHWVPPSQTVEHSGDSGHSLWPNDSLMASEIQWLLEYQVQASSHRKLKFRYSIG